VREGLTRVLWPILVVAAFCAPLFVGLGRTDLENDEALYSFSVGWMLEHGDWLNPRASPNPSIVFLEKPPLKFWLVAAPIRLGLLPHNEVGLRVLDALMGGIAFLYVLAIGRRLAGPLCGAIAVMVLFVYEPLLFVHGLRGNNMEAPLVLAYCGGVYHWLAWARARSVKRRRGHVLALGLYFFLGFMTKFVAVLFLPMVLGLATLAFPGPRRLLIDERRHWAVAFGLFLLFAAPWFVYQQVVVGNVLWRVILGEHVYMRFTSTVDPSHLHPWQFYFSRVTAELSRDGTLWLVTAGLLLLLVRTAVSRWLEGFVILAWLLLPLTLMSIVTSKLHHYAYPFLPPLALAGGYGVAWALGWLAPRSRPTFAWLAERTSIVRRRPIVVPLLVTFAVAAIVLSAITLVFGPVRWQVSGVVLLRNSDFVRPLLVAATLFVLAGRPSASRQVVALLIVLLLVPLPAYRRTLTAMTQFRHPMRTTRDCLLAIRDRETRAGRAAQPVYAVAQEKWFLHSDFYYLNPIGGWEEVTAVDDAVLSGALGRTPRLVMIADEDYTAFKARQQTTSPGPATMRRPTGLLLLPGPYAACTREHTRRILQ
jgi:4-amino-4-deoxy-L-arabinose transferase-like glycosyltransferase